MATPTATPARRGYDAAVTAAWIVAGLLPIVGLASLLLRSQLDPHWANPRLHFVLFLTAGGVAMILGYAAGEAAQRRGDARVMLLSLAFLATGGFLGLHAVGTQDVLFTGERSGFKVAVPVGLLIAALFAAGSAFVDASPGFAEWTIRHQGTLRRAILGAMAVWFVWTVAKLPPLDRPSSEGQTGGLLGGMAVLGTILYGIAAARYLAANRGHMTLLAASLVACFVLLAEAMIGVAVTGERKWHASWWEWHGLMFVAYVVVGYAVRREWRDERFRNVYLASTRERSQDVSVLFGDIAGFTAFAERSTPTDVAGVLNAYYELATPLIAREFGGEVEKFMGDRIMATFNTHGNQPDHPARASRAALALQRALTELADANPGWPRWRIGVNSGDAVVREMGGEGYVEYTLVGDTINTAARLESEAPAGGVLIGAETYRRLPDGVVVEAMPGLRVKGKEAALDAYVLRQL
jgi:adenylate cyclase